MARRILQQHSQQVTGRIAKVFLWLRRRIGGQLQAWAAKHSIKIEYIQPGKPQQNAYIERFNRTVRY